MTELQPGITVHGIDIAKRLTRQRKPEVSAALTDEHRDRPEQLRITPPAPTPAPAEPDTPAKPATAPISAFEKSEATLTQHKTRTGSLTAPRRHLELLGNQSDIKLGDYRSRTRKPTAPNPPQTSSPCSPTSDSNGRRRSTTGWAARVFSCGPPRGHSGLRSYAGGRPGSTVPVYAASTLPRAPLTTGELRMPTMDPPQRWGRLGSGEPLAGSVSRRVASWVNSRASSSGSSRAGAA